MRPKPARWPRKPAEFHLSPAGSIAEPACPPEGEMRLAVPVLPPLINTLSSKGRGVWDYGRDKRVFNAEVELAAREIPLVAVEGLAWLEIVIGDTCDAESRLKPIPDALQHIMVVANDRQFEEIRIRRVAKDVVDGIRVKWGVTTAWGIKEVEGWWQA